MLIPKNSILENLISYRQKIIMQVNKKTLITIISFPIFILPLHHIHINVKKIILYPANNTHTYVYSTILHIVYVPFVSAKM